MAARDWGEINFVINLIYEPLFATLFNRELLLRCAARHGDSVAGVIAAGAEKNRTYRQSAALALVRFLLAQDPNNALAFNAWLAQWTPLVMDAVQHIAPLFATLSTQTFESARQVVVGDWRTLMLTLALSVPEVTG